MQNINYEKFLQICKDKNIKHSINNIPMNDLSKFQLNKKDIKLKYICNGCEQETIKSYNYFMKNDECKKCQTVLKFLGKTKKEIFEDFKEELRKENYILISQLKDYENDKSYLNTIHINKAEIINKDLIGDILCIKCKDLIYSDDFKECSNCGSHKYITTMNRFKCAEARCKECDNHNRTNFQKVTDRFIELDLILLTKEREYKNRIDTQLKYICKCGVENEVSRRTCFSEKWQGCNKCMRNNFRLPQEVVEEIFKDENCILISKYKSNNEPLEYICECGGFGYTNLKNFRKGARCINCVDDRRKATNMEKYGVENPMHCPEICEKAIKNSYHKKEFIFPSGRKETVQGYEPYGIRDLLKLENILEEDIIVGSSKVPIINYYNIITDKISKYYPDIYIKSQNRLIEIKSTWTYTLNYEHNKSKWLYASKNGYRMEVYIYDDSKLCVDKELVIY